MCCMPTPLIAWDASAQPASTRHYLPASAPRHQCMTLSFKFPSYYKLIVATTGRHHPLGHVRLIPGWTAHLRRCGLGSLDRDPRLPHLLASNCPSVGLGRTSRSTRKLRTSILCRLRNIELYSSCKSHPLEGRFAVGSHGARDTLFEEAQDGSPRKHEGSVEGGRSGCAERQRSAQQQSGQHSCELGNRVAGWVSGLDMLEVLMYALTLA